MSRPSIAPGQVWFVGLDPGRGREQGKDRPALVVSSRFHLDVTLGQLVSVLPLASVERRGWLHRVQVGSGSGAGWVITEQIRTIAAERFRRPVPEITLSGGELDEVRRVLAQMLTL